MIYAVCSSCFHRAAGYKNCWNIQTQACGEHSWSNFVTVRNANHGVCAMGINHILNAISNYFSAWQAVKHTVMAHSNTVINGDCVKFFCNSTIFFNFTCDHLAKVLKVNVSRNKLSKAIYYSDDWFSKILIGDTSCSPKSARASHIAAVG